MKNLSKTNQNNTYPAIQIFTKGSSVAELSVIYDSYTIEQGMLSVTFTDEGETSTYLFPLSNVAQIRLFNEKED